MLHHKLPHRSSGSFGPSGPGLALEWITATWLRFEATLAWLALLPLIFATPWPNFGVFLGALLLSPVAAVAFLFALKAAGWLIYAIRFGPTGQVLGWLRLAFLWSFSRLIAEPAPSVEMPLWIGR